MKLAKKILTVVLAANIFLSAAFPAAATEESEKPEIADSSISELMNADNVNPLSGKETEPFNAPTDSNILMTKENELLLYTSNSNKISQDAFKIFEKMGSDTSYKFDSGTSPSLGLSFVTAVALDATGNGPDDHVAYLGVKNSASLQLVLYNARTKKVVATATVGDVSSWVKDVEHYAYKTFFSVTAGDYDNDGIDEVACTDHNMGVQLFDISQGSLSKGKRYDWSALVTKSEDMKIAASDVNRRALISLTSGNFDGTGAEELAAAVSTNHPGSSNLPNTVIAYTTHVAAIIDPLKTGAITTCPIRTTSKGNDEEEQDYTYHQVIYAGQIAAGDLDGDRIDEIAVAGYSGRIELNGDGNFEDGRYEVADDTISLCYVAMEGNSVGHTQITVDEMTAFIEEGFFSDSELLTPLSIDAAKLNGQYGKESIFVGGKVYQFSDGNASAIYTHPFFDVESSFVYTDAYVEHVTSGVFAGKDPKNGTDSMINEQFVFTVVEKDNSQNEYNYKVGFISASTNSQTNAASFQSNSSKMNSDGYLLEERDGGVRTGYGTALVPVAADIDDDGMLVKHTNTTYFYEDPSVEAVLQAAPYFDELGSWNDFNGTTSYSITVSRSLVDIWGYTHSIHAGGKGKLEGDWGEIELKVGYALDLDYEHELAYTSAYTTTFTAGPYDTVVVQRTPYVCYEYSFVDLNGNLLTGDAAGSVVFMEAMHPVYFQLSVDEYNQFVDQYNAMAERHDNDRKTSDGTDVTTVGDSYRLVKITSDILPAGTTGNPENYYSTLRGGEYISQGTYALGTNGGFTGSEFSYEVEKSYSATYAHGLHFELEGVGKVTKSVGIGAFVALSFQETCGSGSAEMNGNATGGEVANINPQNYSTTEQKTLNKYGFNWRCALWKKSLMTNPDGSPYCDSDGNELLAPVVGYVITNVKSPMAAPTGVDAQLSTNGRQVKVNWIASPDGSGALMGYYVYRSCDEQDPVQINSNILSATATSYVDSSDLKPGKIYTYYVVARYNNGGSKYLTMNSQSSTVVWGISQEAESSSKYTGSMFANGSLTMVMSMAALVAAVASLGINLAAKKKTASTKAEDED